MMTLLINVYLQADYTIHQISHNWLPQFLRFIHSASPEDFETGVFQRAFLHLHHAHRPLLPDAASPLFRHKDEKERHCVMHALSVVLWNIPQSGAG